MKRLTRRLEDDRACFKPHLYGRTNREVCDRLAAYEDTGLDPEEIEQLKRERDAAIEDLSGQCKYCLNEKDCVTRKGPHWDCWEWRGVQKEENT